MARKKRKQVIRKKRKQAIGLIVKKDGTVLYHSERAFPSIKKIDFHDRDECETVNKLDDKDDGIKWVRVYLIRTDRKNAPLEKQEWTDINNWKIKVADMPEWFEKRANWYTEKIIQKWERLCQSSPGPHKIQT